MRKLLKYLLPLIVAAAFWNSADDTSSPVRMMQAEDVIVDDAANHMEISAEESEFFLPRPTSFTNAQRVQSTARRTTGAQRNNIEFAKSGKVVNAGLRYFTQKKSLIIHSTLLEPAHRLLHLGKLII